MKKTMIILGLAFSTLLAPAFAQNKTGSEANGLPQGTREQIKTLVMNHRSETKPIMLQIAEKRAQLVTLTHNLKPDLKSIEAKTKEISDLGLTMAKKETAFRLQMKSLLGDKLPEAKAAMQNRMKRSQRFIPKP